MAKWSAFLGGITYLAWVTALVMYGVANWGSSSVGLKDIYVVGLSKAIDGQQVNVTLGYGGVCLYSAPLGRADSEEDAISKCMLGYRFPANEDDDDDKNANPAHKSKVTKHFLDEINLEDDTTLDRDELGELLLVAQTLKEDVFDGVWMIAAFALLIFAGILAIIPLFFYLQKRRTVTMAITAVAALSMGFGLMAAGAAALANKRALVLLENEDKLAAALNRDAWPIEFSTSIKLTVLTWAAVGFNAGFVLFAAIACVVRNHRKHMKQKRQGGAHYQGVGTPNQMLPLKKTKKGKKVGRVNVVPKKFRR